MADALIHKSHQSKRIQGNRSHIPRMTSAEFVLGLYFVTNLFSLVVLRSVVTAEKKRGKTAGNTRCDKVTPCLCRFTGTAAASSLSSTPATLALRLMGIGEGGRRRGEVCLSPSSAISAIYVFFFGLGLGPNSNLDETRGAGLNGKRGVLNSQARYLPIT